MEEKQTTVGELIAQLQQHPQDARVIVTFESIYSGYVAVLGRDTQGRVVLDVDDEMGGNAVRDVTLTR